MEDRARQLELFPQTEGRALAIPLEDSDYPPHPGEKSSLALALHWFKKWMERGEYSASTCQTYLRALRIFAQYVGSGIPVGEIAPAQVRNFISWQKGSGVAAKTVEIRGTAVRMFFFTLCEEGILRENPAANVYPPTVTLPPPEVLYQNEAERLLGIARQKAEKGNATALLLLELMMGMGLRLGEVLALRPGDIDTSREPYIVHVRYREERHRHKRRALRATATFPEVYRLYLGQHPASPEEALLHLSPRSIQYLLKALGEEAGVPEKVTPSAARWSFAVQEMRRGVADDLLRRRLGLAPMAWKEAKERLYPLVVTL